MELNIYRWRANFFSEVPKLYSFSVSCQVYRFTRRDPIFGFQANKAKNNNLNFIGDELIYFRRFPNFNVLVLSGLMIYVCLDFYRFQTIPRQTKLSTTIYEIKNLINFFSAVPKLYSFSGTRCIDLGCPDFYRWQIITDNYRQRNNLWN